MNRFELLQDIQEIIEKYLVVCNIGLPSQEMYKINDRENVEVDISKKDEKTQASIQ